MIACNSLNPKDNLEVKRFFTDKNASGFYEWHEWDSIKGLERLVFGVSKRPKNLQAHLERIYYCFQENLDEQLFGAIVDLLIVLEKSGLDLAKRMITGCQTRFTIEQIDSLNSLLKYNHDRTNSLVNSRYSIFSKGLQSNSVLLGMIYGIGKIEEDPILMARDYAEFNQTDKAISLLEKAISANPGRLDLHAELLSLYRSTHNKLGFRSFYTDLLVKEVTLPPEWKQLNEYFTD